MYYTQSVIKAKHTPKQSDLLLFDVFVHSCLDFAPTESKSKMSVMPPVCSLWKLDGPSDMEKCSYIFKSSHFVLF